MKQEYKCLPCLPPPLENKVISIVLAEQIQENFRKALKLHQQGKLANASAFYENIINSQRRHFDFLHLLGVIAYQIQDHRKAEHFWEYFYLYPS